MTKKVQRIKLRCEGSPVRFDATVIASTPDGARIKVEFDGPLDSLELYSVMGGSRMAANMRDRDGAPTDEYMLAASCQLWEVL